MADSDTITLTDKAQEESFRKPIRHTQRCSHEACDGWAWARGYCSSHYHKLRNKGLMPAKRTMRDDLARFHTKYKINPANGCWEWTGALHPSGYGGFGVTEHGEGRYYRAHRWSYENLVGPIPNGLILLHKCDNRRCVNPEHLQPGTHADNSQDCVSKGRHAAIRQTNGPKITWAMATNIRILYARGEHSILAISRIYGVEPESIRGTLKGRAHLHQPSW